jgi:formylglycine-generating enzyme required for sulfatase activity
VASGAARAWRPVTGLLLAVLVACYVSPRATVAQGAPVASSGGAGAVVTAPAARVTNSVGMEFVLIDPGSVRVGSETGSGDEKPAHTVTVGAGFYLQTTEVTQGQWEAVMGINPSSFKGGTRPVENVSWDDAQAFIARLNAKEKDTRYRLPVEAEWEYACRAGGLERDVSPNLDAEAWTSANSGGETHPVAQRKANAWGLFDLRGNVLEWVQDTYNKDAYAQSPRVDPVGPPASGGSRVVRGGSGDDGRSGNFRCAFRDYARPDVRGRAGGFRCARTL